MQKINEDINTLTQAVGVLREVEDSVNAMIKSANGKLQRMEGYVADPDALNALQQAGSIPELALKGRIETILLNIGDITVKVSS